MDWNVRIDIILGGCRYPIIDRLGHCCQRNGLRFFGSFGSFEVVNIIKRVSVYYKTKRPALLRKSASHTHSLAQK